MLTDAFAAQAEICQSAGKPLHSPSFPEVAKTGLATAFGAKVKVFKKYGVWPST